MARNEHRVRFSRILCPIDGSAGSADAVTQAVAPARGTDGGLTLLQVVGRGAVDLLAFGSTANAVVRRAPRPVLVGHPKVSSQRGAVTAPAALVV